MGQLTRGQLAKAAGVNRETVRYYEKHGLLPEPRRTNSNYCIFDSSAVEQLQFIKRAQAVGFSLNEIRELIHLRYDTNSACGDVLDVVEYKIRTIDAQIRALADMRAMLAELAEQCPGGDVSLDHCVILQHFEHPQSIPLSLAPARQMVAGD
ncbi:MAG: heavy metal-responsive transcriptional regulator [Anaerolineae bacterium]